MARLSFYGGVGEIGGNKILLEDGERRLLLDFGFPFKKSKEFYEEYLKPRSGAGLLDLLTMGLIPPLEGLYRDDLATPGLWEQLRGDPLYCRIEQIDGVLLSHAHLDHAGHISLLKSDIPVYSTAVTAFITKTMLDSGKAEFDQQVCYFSPRVYECPSGLKQNVCLTEKGSQQKYQQRQFCVADIDPKCLSMEANQFWTSVPKHTPLSSSSLLAHSNCRFNLRCFRVDHSIPGACAWGVETGSGWLIYSGDLRLHGKRAQSTEQFIQEAARLHPRVLIIEGTNVTRDKNISEKEVYENALKAISGCHSLVIADFSARDIDRLLTFLQIARETGRKLAILPKDAYLLKTLRLLNSVVPDIALDKNIFVYHKTTSDRYPDGWLKNIYQDYSGKTVLAEDVRSAQDQFILCFSFFDINELPSIKPAPGSLYVFSSSEPHDEEQEIDFRRLHKWLGHFGIKPFGVPVEMPDGEWEIPEGEKGLHASGHASAPDLLRIVREINPELIIPVHSEKPDFYVEHFGDKVIRPDAGGKIEI